MLLSQAYLHRDLLPACHALRIERRPNGRGTLRTVAITLVCFNGSDLLRVRLRMNPLQNLAQDDVRHMECQGSTVFVRSGVRLDWSDAVHAFLGCTP